MPKYQYGATFDCERNELTVKTRERDCGGGGEQRLYTNTTKRG